MEIGCESVSHASCGPNLTSCGPNLSHRLTSCGPNLTSCGPNLTSCGPNLTSCRFKPESGCLCNGSSDQSGLEDFLSHGHKSEVDPNRTSEDDGIVDDDLTPEIQQARGIFQCFLSEKHKATTAPFWHPVGPQASDGEMCFRKMDDKFVNREYDSITAFVADFRLMLENCYRFHGVHHWMSKQAQKLEMVLEQKLTLLSRTLREKTTLAVTSGGRFGTEDEKVPAGTSSRRRSVPRNLAAITVGGSESIMVQALRLEELQRAKEEKRQRELERKEAEEVSAKELEDWERSLLALAEPWSVHHMWELPAIGHFLCLAQAALNLPEVVFYELERCLLMPRCSSFLSRVVTSLLCPPHKRPTLHRRPALPYRKWEAELRRKVGGWFQEVGGAEDQVARAEQLGLCRRFFWIVGEASPLEETAFHLLPVNQRVWVLKGLCDHVYETQKDVQGAVLGQPIHECRESILGYDSRENAYVHFPHFCGADLRIYRQSPCLPVEFPLTSFHVKRTEEGSEVKQEVSEFQSGDGATVEDACDGEEDPEGCKNPEGSRSVERLKEENEPCFRVGDCCDKALDTPQDLKENRPCAECSRAAMQRSSRIWNRIQPEIKRKRKRELNANARKLNMKKKRMKKRLQRAANRMKKRKLRKGFDGKIVKRRTASSVLPLEPSFQLVCSSLEDLRRLIGRTEEELDELNSTKKRSGRWPHKRSTVKELHITLIRLLNELLPWEPKLVKAFQKNRARLKKECEDFKKQPEYRNFTREAMDPMDPMDGLCPDATQTAGELQGDAGTPNEEPEAAEHINELVNHNSRCPDHTPDAFMSANETGPFTRASKRRHTAINEELSTLKKSKTDPEITTSQSSESSSVLSVRSTCKPIQALLAKSVGNKVTLINHPSAALIAPVQPPTSCSLTPRSDAASTLTLTSGGPLVYKTAGSVGLLKKGGASVKFPAPRPKPEDAQQVVILPSNLLGQSTASVPNTTARFAESALPVQQVAPLKETSDVTTPSAAVFPFSRTLPTTSCHRTTTESQTRNADANQELRTVCIRDSQSILVTTRGGNTGVVKVQASNRNTLPSGSLFAVSPQLQAFLVSKALTAQSVPGCIPKDFTETPLLNQTSSTNGKDSALKCAVNPPQQTSHRSTIPKIFLVNPTSNIPTTSTTWTAPGSSAMLINPASANSSTLSEFNASQALNVTPEPKASVGSAIKNAVLTSRTVSRSSENLPKTGANGKTLTFSTLGTGHMASSELLCVMKNRESRIGSSSFLGSLVNKRTTQPVTSHPPSVSGALQTGSSLSPAVRSVQEKIVINTSAPLAPGTQLLINNARFVVPPQGLSTGSHVLLISQGSNSSFASVPSFVQGIKVTAPEQSLIRFPSPNASSDGVRQQSPSVLSFGSVSSSNVARLPVSDGVVVQPSQSGSTSGSLSRLLGTTPAMLLQSPLTPSVVPSAISQNALPVSQNAPAISQNALPISQNALPISQNALPISQNALPVSQNALQISQNAPAISQNALQISQNASTISQNALPISQNALLVSQNAQAISQNALPISQNAPVATRAPSISRMQNLPVATVPPIGCPVTVPPSIIMTSCRPIRALQHGAIGKHVVLSQQTQTQSTSTVQMTSGNLLVSPEGAVLNIIPAKPVTVQMKHPIITTRGTVPVLNTHSPERH